MKTTTTATLKIKKGSFHYFYFRYEHHCLKIEKVSNVNAEKTKQNGQLNQALGEHANALRVEDVVAGGYKPASRAVVAQIQSRIKARRCAANFVMLVELSE